MTFARTQYRLRIAWTPQLRWISLRSADRIAIPKTACRKERDHDRSRSWHAARQGSTVPDFRRPSAVYQLSLQIGASYEATCWTLARHRFIQAAQARELLQIGTSPAHLRYEY